MSRKKSCLERVSNWRPPAWKTDALTTTPQRHVFIDLLFVAFIHTNTAVVNESADCDRRQKFAIFAGNQGHKMSYFSLEMLEQKKLLT